MQFIYLHALSYTPLDDNIQFYYFLCIWNNFYLSLLISSYDL